MHEGSWRFDDDQLESTKKLLAKLEGFKIENIPVHEEEGISAIAFAFKDIVDDFGEEMQEIAMDSTCKLSFY